MEFFLVEDVCVDNLEITQVENNKIESLPIKLEKCIDCQIPVKKFIRDYLINCLP